MWKNLFVNPHLRSLSITTAFEASPRTISISKHRLAVNLSQWTRGFGIGIARAPSLPRPLSKQPFELIGENYLLEEETLPAYVAEQYYPARIGEVFEARYQIVGKLGFGTTSTVWLARDLYEQRYVTLKIFIHSQSLGNEAEHELNVYKRLCQGSKFHPGKTAVRTLLNSFFLKGPDGEHHCLVHSPMWNSVKTFLRGNPVNRLPPVVLVVVLKRLFMALDYIHNECHVIHTDIKADNIMFGVEDDAIFIDFEEQERQHPSPRKEIDGRVIYLSRKLPATTKLAPPVLCDFGSAVFGDVEQNNDVQPDVYRSPEVILGIPWSYPIDIWNAGCMIWDIFENRHLFYGTDPEHESYRSRAHLAESISLLGPPPQELVERGKWSSRFFSQDGKFQPGIEPYPSNTLEALETNLESGDKEMFMKLVRKMLQWKPENRMTARELCFDPWLNKF